jgi:hypothetical protein
MSRHRNPANLTPVLMALVLVGVGLSQTDVDALQAEIRKKHLAALGDSDALAHRRAVQRFGTQRKENPESWRALLKIAVSPPWSNWSTEPIDAAMALARVGPDVLPDVLAELKKWDGEDESGWSPLLCIGRIGPDAVIATPHLLERLAAEETSKDMKSIIRVVLANVGYESEENLDAILTSIKGPGHDERTVLTMALTGSREWVTPEMILALAKRMETGGTDPMAALALGVLKERAAPAIPALERSLKASLNARDYTSAHMLYGFALAQVAPERRREALRSVFAKLGPKGIQGRTDMFAFLYVS